MSNRIDDYKAKIQSYNEKEAELVDSLDSEDSDVSVSSVTANLSKVRERREFYQSEID